MTMQIMLSGLFIGILMLVGVLFIFKFHNKLKHNIAQLKTLRDIDRLILSSLTSKGIINGIIAKLSELINPDAVGIYTFNKQGTKLNLLAGYNLNSKLHINELTRDDELVSPVIINKKPLILNKIGEENGSESLKALRQEGFVGYLGVPVIRRGSVPDGVIAIYSKTPRSYPKIKIESVKAVSNQLAIALDRIQDIARMQEMHLESVLALVQAIEMRDPYTRGHSFQVAHLSTIIGQAMNFTERELELIKFAGLLHDVGKIAVPESILQKPSGLNDYEWQIIKRHPVQSALIIEPIKALHQVLNYILHHHERWDGKGYPEGRKEKNIPLQSRILAIADTYSAMTGDRPYRKGLTSEQTIKEIRRIAGTQLDFEIVKIFLSLSSDEFNKKSMSQSQKEPAAGIKQEEVFHIFP